MKYSMHDLQKEIDLNGSISLLQLNVKRLLTSVYLNHKPEGGIKLQEIENSLSHAQSDGKISQDKLKSLVMQFGETVGDVEFYNLGMNKAEKMTTAEFVQDLLKMQI